MSPHFGPVQHVSSFILHILLDHSIPFFVAGVVDTKSGIPHCLCRNVEIGERFLRIKSSTADLLLLSYLVIAILSIIAILFIAGIAFDITFFVNNLIVRPASRLAFVDNLFVLLISFLINICKII